MVAAGKPNKQIAAELAISERTARTHVSRILRKLRWIPSRTVGGRYPTPPSRSAIRSKNPPQPSFARR